MVDALKLSGVKLNVFAIIYGFSQDGESRFTGSRRYLGELTGVTRPTIDKAIEELIDAELVFKFSENRNGVIFNSYAVNTEAVKNLIGCKETLQGCKETLPRNNSNNIALKKEISVNTYKEKVDEESIPQPNAEKTEKSSITAAVEVFDFWNTKNIVKHKELSPQIRKAIDSAIKQYGYSAVLTAINRYWIVYSNTKYFFKYKWSLLLFLKQKNALPSFLDDGDKWNNYMDFIDKPTGVKKVITFDDVEEIKNKGGDDYE